jgi:uncharacterized protein
MTADLPVSVLGETLLLLPERAVFWPAAAVLWMADTHWGKAAAFRAAGLPVPRGTTLESLTRIDQALDRTGARSIYFLGDFLHAAEGRVPGTLAVLSRWRQRWPGIDMVLVRGNHDRAAGDPPEDFAIRCVDGPLHEGPFSFVHHPRRLAGRYVIAGHIHPAARLAGRGRQRARLPCFWFREGLAVLPAFGDFTGNAVVEPVAGDRVYVVAGDSVLQAGR